MRRNVIGLCLAIAVGTLPAVVVATPAQATDYTFSVSYHHAASGALAVRVRGDIEWHNRSVSLRNIRLWVRAGECGRGGFFGFGGVIDYRTTAERCAGSANTEFSNITDITLDGDTGTAGVAINYIDITAIDETHGGAYELDTYSRN
ncbi:hypothetical protein ACQEUX_10795 [Micromonospora sp. CA-259024]|uniref:hypothetical protein n=1 Tax=Micromonospora sp. CA-259024 TaxID=3239965 RepID=UPI003D911268